MPTSTERQDSAADNDGVGPHEEAFAFDCEGEALVGILHRPPHDAPCGALGTGVVVIVGGPQYRAGSHRQFVSLARALAAAGHPVLRFDSRGMGDSSGALRQFEQITPDVKAASDALCRQVPQVQRIALWGLCDAASAALLYAHAHPDTRVRGLCLLNPWVRSEASLARTQVKHYYAQRLRQRGFWLKLLSGRVAGQAVRGLWSNLLKARQKPGSSGPLPFQARMADAWRKFDGSLLLALSGDDYTAKEFLEFAAASPDWHGLFERRGLSRVDLPDADHTLSASADQRAMNSITIQWLGSLP
ncbi:MAG: hydrolase 1, exosortase A system-associated [Burkholderiaceae bacterium]|nr:hydrolase 1, exosortase A system-associated [Burkholderiaceae bacterium]